MAPAAAHQNHAASVATMDRVLDDERSRFEAELQPLIGVAMRLAAGMRLDRGDAEDAVQEAAFRAWRRRANRRVGTDLRPWFLAIVANQCRETRRGRWATVLRLADPPVKDTSIADDPAGVLDMSAALQRLPHDVRLAVVLRFYLDLPFEEVAAASGCAVEAARSRVRRGLAALAAALAAPGEIA